MPGCGVCGRAFAYEESTKDCNGCGATVGKECWRDIGCVACVEFPDGPLFGNVGEQA